MKDMNRIVFFLLLSIFTLSACSREGQNKEERLRELRAQQAEISLEIKQLEQELGAKDVDVAKVVLTTVNPDTFQHVVQVQAKVDGNSNLHVGVRSSGMVQEIRVKEGSVVKEGDLLGKLDDALFVKALNEANTSYRFLIDVYQKQKALWDQKIGSEVQYLQAKNNKEAAEARIASLEEQIDMCLIKAPISGTIEEVPIRLGQILAPPMVAFRIVNLATSKVVGDVSEAYSASIRAGSPVFIEFPDLGSQVATKISFASNYISPINRSFVVEAPLPQGMKGLKANLVAKLKIVDYQDLNALVVSANWLIQDARGTYLYVAETANGVQTAKKRYVKPGLSSQGQVQILEGLAPGDLVVSLGYQNLEEGMVVENVSEP